jgi:pSer/pThr/pTyr-binding forkhead associated (FHA) protein
MSRHLIATAGPLKGQRFILGQRTIIGRADGTELQILTEGVSRQHAAIIENDDGLVYLMDLASKNGTFVDERPILRVQLEPGTVFRLSNHEFQFVDDDSDPFVDKTHRRGRKAKAPDTK